MEKISFDYAVKRLEEIVGQLENGQLDLEESLRVFEEGVELSLYCRKELQETESKVNILVQKVNGEFQLEEFAE